ncbi:MAG: HNH endonuclease [Parcubacteria group bacterium Gr01-1014_48]|nr:MAG: HNH endonuclease [Parcubacteria group bacterium Greene0416_14]TSC74609.1 MAG: HNH endonuclease [Parcubacteria group bacterium Gr01-1014_48]TSD01592.1 MAG: HNH endonuclease [Parcubacteria group bacterium Greene1014_15]TSD08359.1 MAG: HNH endonuclease [Parcubacteria group bacterium Greene0714_4]
MAGPFANTGEIKKAILRILFSNCGGGRPKVGAIIRLLVYMRDELRCVYCRIDCSGKSDTLTLDHIIPASKGGGSHLDNLATSCKNCNKGKRDSLVDTTARATIQTFIWQANKRFLKHLDFEQDAQEILDAVLASVENAKKVLVFWNGQQHIVLEWSNCFVLKNAHTEENIKIYPATNQSTIQKENPENKKKRSSAYERLEKIMHLLHVTPQDINR